MNGKVANSLRYALCLVLLWIIPAGTLVLQAASPVRGADHAAAGKKLTILFTNDMHSNANPRTLPYESYTVKGGDTINIAGGYARLAALINREREIAREEGSSLILVDAGDMAMGTVFHSVFLDEAFELRSLARMGYDAYTFGNHDFDFGADGLGGMILCALRKERVSPYKLPRILAANIRPDTPGTRLDTAFAMAGIRGSMLIERDGVKIGIIGLLGEHAYSVVAKKEGLKFLSPIETAGVEAKKLQERGADFIVAISHGGTLYGEQGLLDSSYIKGQRNRKYPAKFGQGKIAMNLEDKDLIYANSKLRQKSQDGKLAMNVPLIDVIISGHDHEYLYAPFIINRTIIGSSGGYNCMLGKMVLEKDSLISYELLPITRDISPDTSIQAWIDTIAHKIDTTFYADYGIYPFDTIGTLPRDYGTKLDGDGSLDLGHLIAGSYKYAALKYAEGADASSPVALVPMGNIRNSIARGAVTYNDVFNVLSLGKTSDGKAGYPLVLAWLSGKELIDVCEMVATVSPQMEDTRLFFDGLTFTYNQCRLPFTKVTGVNINGVPVEKEKLYPVVTGMYTAMLIGLLKSESHGILSAIPKDKNGVPVTDFSKHVLHKKMENGEYTELAEWVAFAEYLREKVIPGDLQLTKSAINTPRYAIYLKYFAILGVAGGIIYILIRQLRKKRRKSRSGKCA